MHKCERAHLYCDSLLKLCVALAHLSHPGVHLLAASVHVSYSLVLGSHCLRVSSGPVDSCCLELALLLLVPFAGACQRRLQARAQSVPRGRRGGSCLSVRTCTPVTGGLFTSKPASLSVSILSSVAGISAPGNLVKFTERKTVFLISTLGVC